MTNPVIYAVTILAAFAVVAISGCSALWGIVAIRGVVIEGVTDIVGKPGIGVVIASTIVTGVVVGWDGGGSGGIIAECRYTDTAPT